MPYLSNKRLLAEMSIALVMAIVATLTLEHSQIDLMVADWFYLGMGHWMVAKQAFLPDLLLYSGLKKLLMAMLIYLLVATICRAYHEKKGNAITAKWLVPVTKFRVRELAYLVLTLILVPTVVASLKAYTHVVCPVHLTIFDGTLPYLPMLDSMRNTIPDKCFPAAHASSGFALFAFAFAPSLRRRRGAIIIVVMALGWAMGCYKMIIGDHFLSHTVVSMMLAWAMSAGLAWVFFKKGEQVQAFKSKNGRIGYYGTVFSVEFQSDDSSTWKLPIGTALLTPIGQELMKICGSTPDIAYLNKFLNKINVEGSQVKLSIINM
ncbi:PAP2 family protein [Escherichia coli]|nr:PAP2 family protein [Escherichia coli]EJZ1645440.1 PAP2 family protein [Escherichia coli]EKD1101159.1 PAP2 family protein [Escherichia coli]EKD1102004.1 PAP2 family protein [Escherichia coli]HDD8936423.1 PAP2 family protein [Escherichia coli]